MDRALNISFDLNITNVTSNQDELHGSTEALMGLRIFKIFCYVVIFVIGSVGNTLVILLVYRKRLYLYGVHHLFLSALAISDLFVLTFNLPFRLAYQEKGYSWPFGAIMCKIIPPMTYVFTTASSALLMAVCLERHRTTVHPLRKRFNKRQISITITAIWLVSILISVPLSLQMEIQTIDNRNRCTDIWSQRRFEHFYFICVFLLQFVVPSLIITFVYAKISRTLLGDNNTSRNDSSNGQRKRRRHIRVVRMIVIVVVIHYICIMPYYTFTLITQMASWEQPLLTTLKEFLVLLAIANSMVNPIIYGSINHQYRHGYTEYIRQVIGCDDSSKRRVPLAPNPRRRAHSGFVQQKNVIAHVHERQYHWDRQLTDMDSTTEM